MNKRLISLLLCLVTVLSLLLTGCAESTDDEISDAITEAESQGATTMTMWVVSEKAVSEETCAEITAAVNTLTQTNHKVKLVIKYFTGEEYYEELSKTINAYTNTYTPANSTSKEDVNVDGDGLYHEIYPALQENQVDIVYIGDLHNANGELIMSGADMYEDMISKGWLAALDQNLDTGSAAKIREYVSPVLLNAAKHGGSIYAVPNNNTIGEYTYMLLNKELMDRYSINGYFNKGMIDGFYNRYVYQFLNMVLADSKNNGKVLPVDATYEECLALLANYWSVDPEEFTVDTSELSLFGTLAKDIESLSRGETTLDANNLFANADFVSAYLQLNKYRLEEETFFRTVGNTNIDYENTAVKFHKGNLGDLTMQNGVPYYYEDGECYYAIPVAYPTVSEEDVYGNMFGVCSYNSADTISRCMDIITDLNTDSELRNLLQYGVEEEHYNIVDDKIVRTEKGKEYAMDLYATGNAFVAYPEAWMNENIWENGKLQNRDALIAPMMGFDLAKYAARSTTLASAFASTSSLNYQLSYDSGYSREVLSQDPVIKAWIDACDKKATKDIYMLRTYEKVGKNYVNTYYVYNTNGTADFEITTKPITMDSREIGLDLTFAYTNVKNKGYELSVVNYTVPDNYTGKITCTVNGKDAGAYKLENHKANIDFDFFDTDKYSIDYYTNLTMAHFYNNDAVYSQLKAWKAEETEGESNYLLTWTEEGVDGTTKYNYVVYRKGITKATSMVLQPTGGAAELALNFNYTSYSNKVGGAYLDYVLSYVCVTADEGVVIQEPRFALNRKSDTATVNTVVSDQVIDLNMVGAIDTALVQYVAGLEEQIFGLLNACTTYEEFETMVKDLQTLFTTEADASALKSEALKNSLMSETEGVVRGDLDTLKTNLLRYSDHRTLKEILALESSEVIEELGEEVVYLYSPFGIYYKWLEANQYLPKK